MKCWYAVFLKTLICTVILFRISKNLLYWKWILKNTINTTPSSNTKCAKSLKILQYCSLACPLDHSKYYWEKLLIEMYLIFASRMAPSPFLNIWACECCSTINFQCCRTLSFFMPCDPSHIHARKVSRPSGSDKKTCRGSEHSAGRLRGSTAGSVGKECLMVALVCRSRTLQKILKAHSAI